MGICPSRDINWDFGTSHETRSHQLGLCPSRDINWDSGTSHIGLGVISWDSAHPGTSVRQSCPAYMERVITTRQYHFANCYSSIYIYFKRKQVLRRWLVEANLKHVRILELVVLKVMVWNMFCERCQTQLLVINAEGACY